MENPIPLESHSPITPILDSPGPASTPVTAVVPEKIIGSSTSIEVYEPFRNLLTRREAEYSLILSFFNDKIAVENSYIKDKEKLLKKYSTLNLSNGKSTSLALSSFMEFTTAQQEESIKYKDQIQSVAQSLEDLKKAIDNSTRQLKEVVKPVARKYTEVASITVPKMKAAYAKRLELWEKESVDSSISGQKIYKINREAEVADLSYRTAIVELEDIRIELEQVKQKASIMWEVMERQRGEFLTSCLKQLSASINESQIRLADKLNSFARNAESVSFEEDCKLAVDYFLLAFPEREPILFEHYKTKDSAKDLVFGVSLEHALRTSSKNGVPHLLQYCFDAIEQRGLEKQGIYRISPKKIELAELKTKVETNVHSVPYMSEDLDIHSLAGLVKLYLRELPTPIFLFSTKDRAEYSSNPDIESRISRLNGRVRALSKENKTLLEAIIAHLNKVNLKCAINKMTMSNLSMVFSAVLFQGQEQAAPDPASMTAMFFGRGNAPVDTAALELLKNDLVIEDMMKYSEHLFKGAPFRDWTDPSGYNSTKSPSLEDLASQLSTPLHSNASPTEVIKLPPLPPRTPSGDKLNRSLHDIPESLPSASNDTPIAAALEILDSISSSPKDSPVMSPKPEGHRSSRSFFAKIGGVTGINTKHNKKTSETVGLRNSSSTASLNNIHATANDSPLSAPLSAAVDSPQKSPRFFPKTLDSEKGRNGSLDRISHYTAPLSRQGSIQAPLNDQSQPSPIQRKASKANSSISASSQNVSGNEKSHGSNEKLPLSLNTSQTGLNRSAEALPSTSPNKPSHSRENPSSISIKSGKEENGSIKDKVFGIFKRRPSTDQLKSTQAAGPPEVVIRSPMTKRNSSIDTSSATTPEFSSQTKSKASIINALPHLRNPDVAESPSLTSLMDNVFQGLASPGISADTPVSPTTPKKPIRGKTKKKLVNADDDDYIDPSLFAAVQGNMLEMDQYDDEDEDDDLSGK